MKKEEEIKYITPNNSDFSKAIALLEREREIWQQHLNLGIPADILYSQPSSGLGGSKERSL